MQTTYAQKNETTQRAADNTAAAVHDNSPQSVSLQRHASLANAAVQRAENPPRPNNTGLPDDLKNGVESLSGYSLDNVRVHYNSPKPATVQALAYTQGTDIHVAPGQEHALPHEAWHVAQQMAGRVSPTTNINGVPVNDNAGLEHEADVMGEKAMQCMEMENTEKLNKKNYALSFDYNNKKAVQRISVNTIQCESYFKQQLSHTFAYHDHGITQVVDVGHIMNAHLDHNDVRMGQEASYNTEQDAMMEDYRIKTGLLGGQLVKGHLLNAHLGGSAYNRNLFPITDGANYDHLGYVENFVKHLLINGYDVDYSVIAQPTNYEDSFNEGWNTSCREAVFNCQYEGKKANTSIGPVNRKIVSHVNSNVSKKARGSVYDENKNWLKVNEIRSSFGCYDYSRGLNTRLSPSSNPMAVRPEDDGIIFED